MSRSVPGSRVVAPDSPHSVRVTGRASLAPVADWSRDDLYRAVRRADEDDAVVVVDYGRDRLLLAAGTDLTYHPPRALGLAAPPSLTVVEPAAYDPESDAVRPVGGPRDGDAAGYVGDAGKDDDRDPVGDSGDGDGDRGAVDAGDDGDGDGGRPRVVVGPAVDVLVPAFDDPEPAGEDVPPARPERSRSPAGTGIGDVTPG